MFGVEHGDVDGKGVGVETLGFGEGEEFGPLLEGLGKGPVAEGGGVVVVHDCVRSTFARGEVRERSTPLCAVREIFVCLPRTVLSLV